MSNKSSDNTVKSMLSELTDVLDIAFNILTINSNSIFQVRRREKKKDQGKLCTTERCNCEF